MSSPTPTSAPEPALEPAPQPESTALVEAFAPHVPDDKKDWFNFKDDKGFTNTVFSLVEMAGKKGDIPADNATPEQIAEFWGKMGAGDIKPGEYEYGEEFGDLAPALKERHSEVDKKVTELFNEALKGSRSIAEVKDKVLKAYLQSEAESEKQALVEAQRQNEEDFAKVATESGLTPEQLQGTIKGVMSKYGWDEHTPIPKVLYTLAKETTDTKGLEQAYLHNTNEGLELQIKKIAASDEFLRQDGAAHQKAVEEHTRLLAKLAEKQKNG